VSYELDLTLIIVPASCGSSQTCSLLYLKKVRYLYIHIYIYIYIYIYPLFSFPLKFFVHCILQRHRTPATEYIDSLHRYSRLTAARFPKVFDEQSIKIDDDNNLTYISFSEDKFRS